jgi:integrase/recombinase XerD
VTSAVSSSRSSWPGGGRPGHVRSQSRPGLLCLLEVLRSAGVAAEPAARPVSATDALLASFERYLLPERGLAAGTVAGYLDQARRFLAGLTAGLAEVTSAEVSAAVLRVSASVSVATAQNFVFGLRAFLRFCFLEGLIDTGLSGAALPVTGRRRFALPRGIAGAVTPHPAAAHTPPLRTVGHARHAN